MTKTFRKPRDLYWPKYPARRYRLALLRRMRAEVMTAARDAQWLAMALRPKEIAEQERSAARVRADAAPWDESMALRLHCAALARGRA